MMEANRAPQQQSMEPSAIAIGAASQPGATAVADSASQADFQVAVIGEADFQSTAEMLADAFAEKRGRGCCQLQSRDETIKDEIKGWQKTLETCPQKMQRIAVIRDNSGSYPVVLGYCALMGPNDVGNLSLPSWMRHKLVQGEVHLEQIGVSEKARGKGLGTKLMQWAEAVARSLGAKFISLEVMAANPAKRLYEREGYVVTRPPSSGDCIEDCCDACLTPPIVFLFHGVPLLSSVVHGEGIAVRPEGFFSLRLSGCISNTQKQIYAKGLYLAITVSALPSTGWVQATPHDAD
eukprot:gnl/TRDRNA2_/TRDRNA2_172425_c1_seq1.p1 gnl/TRDRNA2_/TRDRNA2_172425_c1~~gnl/TRDRNA2_/TRDRNA2_172425_c1_seq1.p1  ORF type:complete len:293 (+),score=38.42 gnl/TRDRNA2_/TRDRNA2_172425_c1_seq1:196-1074(+)